MLLTTQNLIVCVPTFVHSLFFSSSQIVESLHFLPTIDIMVSVTSVVQSRPASSSSLKQPMEGRTSSRNHIRFLMDAKKSFLAGSAAVLMTLSTVDLPAQAVLGAPPGDRWDGESSAIGSCPLGEQGEQCRANILAKDTMLTYGQMNNSGKVSGKATGVPVSDVTSTAYKRDTTALADSLKVYMTLDPSDDNRVGLVKTLKKESLDWVSKYARGGSARAKSARTLYVVVDAVQGHLASNGYAPFPRMKATKLVAEVDTAMEFLAQGR